MRRIAYGRRGQKDRTVGQREDIRTTECGRVDVQKTGGGGLVSKRSRRRMERRDAETEGLGMATVPPA